MKILSIAIPCYNSEEYMEKAIKSCLGFKEELEIFIINDGSKDNTGLIADEYQRKYPECVHAIHKENGGHGDAVTVGLENSTGLYFKVLDSDDWFDENSLQEVIDKLKYFEQSSNLPDMIIANYVYENVSMNKSKSIKYNNAMPEDRIFTWNEIGHLHKSQNILMHSVIYKTEVLKKCKLVLPKHTFYVDNIFVFKPLPYVKTMYYINTDLYRYFIGREDQSVNEKIMIERIDQQILVTKLIIDYFNESIIESEKLKKYMIKYIVMMMTVSTVLLVKGNTKEMIDKKNELWIYLKTSDKTLYKSVSRCFLGMMMQRKGMFSRKIIIYGYLFSRKLIGFN